MFFSSHLFPAVVLRSVLAPIPRGHTGGGWVRGLVEEVAEVRSPNIRATILQFGQFAVATALVSKGLHWLAKAKPLNAALSIGFFLCRAANAS